VNPQTFQQFAQVYKERHVFAKGLAIGNDRLSTEASD
jgi:hypothetical protein